MGAGTIVVREDPALESIVRRCYCDVEVTDRRGVVGRGYTNLKRIYGSPSEITAVISALASTVGGARAVASSDAGSAPLAALVAYERSLPAVFVRSLPKTYGLSYGAETETNDARIFGDDLAEGTLVHLVDDFVHSGATLAAAVATLRSVGLVVSTGSAILGSPVATIADAIAALEIELTVFATTDRL